MTTLEQAAELALPEEGAAGQARDETQAASGLAAALEEIQEMGEEVEPEVQAAASILDVELPEQLMRTVDLRLNLWRELIKIDQQREELGKNDGGQPFRSELARQRSEMKRLPNAETLAATATRLEKKFNEACEAAAKAAAAPKPAGEEEEDDAPIDPAVLLQLALDLGLKQNRCLMARAQFDVLIPKAAAPIVDEEPLLQAVRSAGLDVRELLSWSVYTVGLEKRKAECREAEDKHYEKVAALNNKGKKGGLLRRRTEKAAPPPNPSIDETRQAISREMQAVEPVLADMYWDLYELLAWPFVDANLTEDERCWLRAYLRYGLVSRHPALIDPAKSAYIDRQCRESVYGWDNTLDAVHVVYADEHLEGIYNQKTTVSPDEDLELNERGSDVWKADRVWRQAVYYRNRVALMSTYRDALEKEVEADENKLRDMEAELKSLREQKWKDDEIAAMDEKIATFRPVVARQRQNLELLDEKVIPEAEQWRNSAEGGLSGAMVSFSKEDVVKREALFVRRLSRLAARLKTPYLQFVLRDNFEPGKSDEHRREAVCKAVQRVEFADTGVFHQILVPNAKRNRRVTMRCSPEIVIVPSRGAMGISITPRRPNDDGELAMPLLGQKPGLLEQIVTDMLADFVWDSSMEEAGADWIKADALCSGYANVRWNFRRKNPETQKKAGFDRKKKDRQDWRGHYALWVGSAEDAGRKLFYRCYDVYEIVVKYIGMPPGIARLRRD